MPRLLMACAHPWNSPFRLAAHHLARCFVGRGWQVGFVCEPFSPLYLARGLFREFHQRYALHRRGGRMELDGGLWAYAPGALITPHNRPLLRAEWLHRRWVDLTWPPLRDELRRHGFERVDLLYVDGVIHTPWVSGVQAQASIFRIGDNLRQFPTWTPALERLQRELARRVDAVVFSAEGLRRYAADLQPRDLFYLPNGVEYEHFARPAAAPPEYGALPRPIAIYVGALDRWFDFELVAHAAAALPDVSFVLVGPTNQARRHLKSRHNLHLLGPRPYSAVPAYLQHADVGLIPFDLARFGPLVHTVHPIKLYEYLAAGLPVVATAWDELKRLDSPARLCTSAAEFHVAVAEATRTPAPRAMLREFAARHDWEQRAATLRAYFGW